MKPVHESRASESAFKVCGLVAFASLVTLAQAQEASVEALKEGVEGVYVLQEFHRNGDVMRPPLVVEIWT